MSEYEWKTLFVTTDGDIDFLRLGRDMFPYNTDFDGFMFDVKLPDSDIIEKCLVFTKDSWRNARALTEDGKDFELPHGTMLMFNPDRKLEARLERMKYELLGKEYRENLIKNLTSEREGLTNRLQEIDKEIERLKKLNK